MTEMTAISQGKAWIQLACSGACGRGAAGFPGCETLNIGWWGIETAPGVSFRNKSG